jgi:hypothetical protein
MRMDRGAKVGEVIAAATQRKMSREERMLAAVTMAELRRLADQLGLPMRELMRQRAEAFRRRWGI